jgi:Rps23 Pro-64 3,4-dihydroxylase Tpa1-like proline 4-hydroxylase
MNIQVDDTFANRLLLNVFEDYLLCHDDDIHGTVEGRRIAFIYYLVPENWTDTDGGTLDLFATDGKKTKKKRRRRKQEQNSMERVLSLKIRFVCIVLYCRRQSTMPYC